MSANVFDNLSRAEFSALQHAQPPNSLETEEAVLGAILLDPHAMPIAGEMLAPDDFFHSPHRHIFSAAMALYREGRQTDLMAMVSKLNDLGKLEKIGGVGTLAQLVEETVSSINIDRYCQLLKEKAIRRQLIALSFDVAKLGYDSLVGLDAIKRGLLEKLESICPPGEPESDQVRRQSDRLVEQVKTILLNPNLRPQDRKISMAKLGRRTGHAPKFLEDLFYLSQVADDNEPLMSLKELRERYGDQVESWLLHGFLNRGRTTLLHAKGGTGKSLLSYDLIYSIVHGEDWGRNGAENYGFPVGGNNQHKCMIIQTDESPSDLSEHLEQRGFDVENDNVRVKTKWNIAHLPHLYEEVRQFQPDLILIDSLTSVSAKNCVSENDMEYARPVLALNAIASEFGCHILILHHSSRGSGEARGSTALEAAVSQVWKLERDDTGWASGELAERLRLFTITKARSRRPAKYRIELNPDTFQWHCLGEVNREDEPIQMTTKQHIIEFLKSRPGVWFEALEIASATNCTYATVRRCCNELGIDKIIQPRKRPGRKATLYRVGDAQNDVIGGGGGDQYPITSPDHIAKPDTPKDTAPSDHVIAQISNFDKNSDVEKRKTPDHMITSAQNPDPEPDSHVIALCDRPSDRPPSQPDHITPPDHIETEKQPRMISYGGVHWIVEDNGGWVVDLVNPRDSSDRVTLPKSELEHLS